MQCLNLCIMVTLHYRQTTILAICGCTIPGLGVNPCLIKDVEKRAFHGSCTDQSLGAVDH